MDLPVNPLLGYATETAFFSPQSTNNSFSRNIFLSYNRQINVRLSGILSVSPSLYLAPEVCLFLPSRLPPAHSSLLRVSPPHNLPSRKHEWDLSWRQMEITTWDRWGCRDETACRKDRYTSVRRGSCSSICVCVGVEVSGSLIKMTNVRLMSL